MIKQIAFTIFSAIIGCNAIGQGLNITKFKNWDEVKQKAQQENKFILVDCYTTWCGPCKQMSEKVFPQDVVGKYANDKFVSVKLQFDSTVNDDEYVKANYALARQFEKDYGIAAYPSFMVFNSEGQPVHRFVGAYGAEEFVKVLEKTTDEGQQFYTLLKRYESDSTNVSNVKKMATAAAQAYDLKISNRAYAQLINLEGDKLLQNKEDLQSLVDNANVKGGVIFDFLSNNYAKIKDASTKELVNDKLTGLIIQQDYLNALFMSDKPDWAGTEKDLKSKYPNLAWDKTIHTSKVTLAYYKKDRAGVLSSLKDMYSKNYLLDDRVINAIAWELFENSDDKNTLKQVSNYMAKNVANSKDAAIIDTYANVLYKSGDKTNGIKWMKKAVEYSDDANKSTFQETLQKMEKGEPTW